MADVFISYSRKDSKRAEQVVYAVGQSGLSIWIDRMVPTAKRWEREISKELEDARCVIMLWSDNARTSDWVHMEGASALERAALVPVRLDNCGISRDFNEVQFADLTAWDGSPDALAYLELLQAIRTQLTPIARIGFESPTSVRMPDVASLYDAYFEMAKRLDRMETPGTFTPSRTSEEREALWRAIRSVQVFIDWPAELQSWINDTLNHAEIRNSVHRIERHIPVIWLSMLTYGGAFKSSLSVPKSHAKYVEFANLSLSHLMRNDIRAEGRQSELPWLLTTANPGFSRWEGWLDIMFDDRDEVACGYVTHIDDRPLPREEVYYGPKHRLQKAYGRSLRGFPYTEPVWFEQYFIPQRELALAREGPLEYAEYEGNLRLRKVTGLNGADIEPLYDE